MKSIGLAILILGLSPVSSYGDVFTPLEIASGFFDRDIIFENTLNVGDTGATSNFGARQFYEDGIIDSDGNAMTNGLPTGGLVSLTSGLDTISFQLQDYTALNNRVLHGGAPKATINFPKFNASRLSFLVSSGVGGDSSFSAKLNYADASSSVATVSGIPNWGTNNSLDAFDVGRTNSNTLTWTGMNDGNFIWSHIHAEIAADPLKALTSIDLTLLSGQVSVMGVSAVPEPSTMAMLGLGLGLLALRRYRTQRSLPKSAARR